MTSQQYRHVIEKIVSAVGRRIDESSPMVDARLPDGSRVNAILPPLAIHGPIMTIRKFAADPYTVKDLINFGTFTLDLSVVMEACVRGKLNILVSGGTGTGKTTNLNVLSSFIPEGERIVTIEDAAELQLQQPHILSLESRPPNAEGAGEVKIRDLVRNALRMRPDRIIVGEVRGAESLDMLQAMNTGHEGSMTTVHSNSPRDALSRIETMVLMAGYDLPVKAIREQITSALNIIMHLDRLSDGRRVVTSVTELQGMEGETILLQEIFKFRQFSRGRERPGQRRAGGHRPAAQVPRQAGRERHRGAGQGVPCAHAARPATQHGCGPRRSQRTHPVPVHPGPGGACAMTTIIAVLAVGGGLALVVAGIISRSRDRQRQLAEILELPYGERDIRVEGVTENLSPLVESTIQAAGKMVTQFDEKGNLAASLERARIPLRPGEFVLVTLAGSLALAALLLALSSTWFFALLGAALRAADRLGGRQAPHRQAQEGVRGGPARRPGPHRLVPLRRAHVPAGHPDDVRGGAAAPVGGVLPPGVGDPPG